MPHRAAVGFHPDWFICWVFIPTGLSVGFSSRLVYLLGFHPNWFICWVFIPTGLSVGFSSQLVYLLGFHPNWFICWVFIPTGLSVGFSSRLDTYNHLHNHLHLFVWYICIPSLWGDLTEHHFLKKCNVVHNREVFDVESPFKRPHLCCTPAEECACSPTIVIASLTYKPISHNYTASY